MKTGFLFKNTICGLRFQPIYCLSDNNIQAWEVLSALKEDIQPERFFSSLSHKICLQILLWQLKVIQGINSRQHYYLNAPTKMLCQRRYVDSLLPLLRSGITIEVQDPDVFFALSDKENQEFLALTREIQNRGASLWLDDIKPEHLPLLATDINHFDGIKIDKTVIWNYQSVPDVFLSLMARLSFMTDSILIEGIENQTQLSLAARSGCSLLQGYYWPEEILNLHFSVK